MRLISFFTFPDSLSTWSVAAFSSLVVLHVPFLIWKFNDLHHIIFLLRISGSVFSFLFFFNEIIAPLFLKSILWNGGLFLSFLILPVLSLWVNNFSIQWVLHLSVSLFILGYFIGFYAYFTFISAGVLFLFQQGYNKEIGIKNEALFLLIYLFFLVVLIALPLIRYREKNIKEKEEIFSSISNALAHELRTPLGQISLESKAIKFASTFDKIYESIKIIENAAGRSLRLIDIFLVYFSKIETSIPLEKLSAIKVIKDMLIEEIHPVDLEKIVCDFQGRDEVYANRVFLDHALINIIKNALYFIKKKGGGNITIKTYNSHNGFFIEIIDTGEGIKQNKINKIFSPFYTTRKDGFGIGLNFVKIVLTKMKAQIFCDSTYKKYTKFTIYFSQGEQII